MDEKPKQVKFVGTVIYARGENGKIYTLSVQRANTKKWNGYLMYGAAGKFEADKDKNLKTTMYREIQEELFLLPEKILSTKVMGIARKVNGLIGPIVLTEVAMPTLRNLVEDINKNPKKYWEIRNARINKVSELGKKKKIIQPHYLKLLPKIKAGLSAKKAKP